MYCRSAMYYVISIHAAREGGDGVDICPLWVYNISIHAAREGGDAYVLSFRHVLCNFNPRRP